MDTPNAMQEHVDEQVLGLVANYGARAVLRALAMACKQGSRVYEDQEEYGRSGRYEHYAHVLEGLFED